MKFLIILLVIPVVIDGQSLVNVDVHSEIDLRKQLVRVKDTITFTNHEDQPVTSYIYVIQDPGLHSLYCDIYNDQNLKYKKLQSRSEIAKYRIYMGRKIFKDQEFSFTCVILYANKLRPAYKKRKLEEDQIFHYKSNTKYFSVYETLFSAVKFSLVKDSLIETSIEASVINEDSVIYKSFYVKPYSLTENLLTFINNSPFLVVKSLERTMSINHYGKIFIEDTVTVANNGPKLDGPYSTLNSGKAVTSWLFTHLPASAQDINFFDIIGNSSQTQIHDFASFNTLRFKTRYPLLGGWKTWYTLQYSVPIHEYLFLLNDSFSLRTRAIDYVIEDALIENVLVKIVLPEGARLGKVFTKDKLVFIKTEKDCTGQMCLFGREIAVLEGHNLFQDYIVNITLDYFFNDLYLLKPPLLIGFYLQIVFVLVIVFVK